MFAIRLLPLLGVNGVVDCKRPGLFRHPELCNKFYSCNWDTWKKKYVVNVFNCPIHLAYDTTIGACNWPSKGPACVNGKLLVWSNERVNPFEQIWKNDMRNSVSNSNARQRLFQRARALMLSDARQKLPRERSIGNFTLSKQFKKYIFSFSFVGMKNVWIIRMSF